MPKLIDFGRLWDIAVAYQRDGKFFEARAFYTEALIDAKTDDMRNVLLDKIHLCNKMESK